MEWDYRFGCTGFLLKWILIFKFTNSQYENESNYKQWIKVFSD